jgi:hypothetical protein
MILSSPLMIDLKQQHLQVWHLHLDFHYTESMMFDEQSWHSHRECISSQLQEWDLWRFLDLINLLSLTTLLEVLLNLQLACYMA